MHTAGRRGPCRQGNKRAVFPGCPRQPGSKETPPAPHPAGNPLYGCPDDEKMPGTGKKTSPFHHAGRLRALSPQKLFHSPPAAQGAADPERHPEFSLKRGWCRRNAAFLVPPPILREKRIRALSLYEAKRLLHTAEQLFHGACLPACALMLYAGIRPHEVKRLTWKNINLKSGLVSLAPCHTKTGGSRHVSILPVLGAILSRTSSAGSPARSVCPPNWEKKWKEVRRRSGILKKSGWVQDVLRHTYASYHLAHFCNQNLLQKEMGHSSPSLLLARYLNMEGITSATGAMFWTHSFIPPAPLKKD